MDKIVLKNTLFLYFRTAITMVIALYTSRVILDVLGVENYGIYTIVGGVVAMFQTLSLTLSGTTQRFITYALGRNDERHLQQVFSASLRVHLVLAIVVLLLAESLGLWFINTHLNIAASRMTATNIVYQCSLLCFVIDIISIPYNSVIVAYEKMKGYAYIYIGQALLRLTNVFLLQLGDFDKLIFYAFLEVLVSILVRISFIVYCKKECRECKRVDIIDKTLYKQMMSFTGWNFIGTSSAIIYSQGGNILINIFFGVTLNAAIGVTNQVQNAVNSFVGNFTIALNPQITKNYALKNYPQTISLIFSGSKVAAYLLMIIAIPIIYNVNYILHTWLIDVPKYTVVFVRLSLILAVVNSFFPTINCAIFATGNIKKYQILSFVINVVKVLLLYIGFKIGLSPVILYIMPIVFTFLFIWIITHELKNDFEFPVNEYFKKTVMVSLTIFISLLVGYYIIHTHYKSSGFIVFILESIIITILNIIIIIRFGLTKNEKKQVNKIIKNRIGYLLNIVKKMEG